LNTNFSTPPFTVLIPDGEYALTLLAIQCLAEVKNITIVLLSNNKNIAPRFSKHVSHFYSYKEKQNNDEDRLEAIRKTLNKIKIDVILPIGDYTIRLLSLHKDSFSNKVKIGLLPPTSVFDIANDKWCFYQWLEKNKINTPFTVLFNDNVEFKDSLRNLKFPVLAKPTKLTGGDGISFFENSWQLEEFLNKESVNNIYIVQDYIKGYNLGFNVLAYEGKILAHTIQKPIISSKKGFQPSYGLSFFHDESIYIALEELISKLNWTGVANLDLRYDEETNQIKVLEMNARYWGNLVGSLMAGVNFPYLSCLVSLGIDLPKNEFKQTCCISGLAAYKYWLDGFKFKRNLPKFENTSIKLALVDPGPYFFKLFTKKQQSVDCLNTNY